MHRSLPIASVAVAAHDMAVDSATDFVVAALYKFVALPDYHEFRERLLDACLQADTRGTLLLAPEGINGTIAGTRESIDAVLSFLRSDSRMADLQEELNADMMVALVAWTRGKPAAKDLSEEQISALVISVFGGWLFFLSIAKQGADVGSLRDVLLNEWATL